MKQIQIGGNGKKASAVMLGCMRIANISPDQLEKLTETALEAGIDSFDFADIYGGGQSESMFGQLLTAKPSLRERILIQSKCGICKGYYDLSKKHILEAADGILSRLHTDHLDLLLLHRPDTLMEPWEIAEAFTLLRKAGKADRFGVSNMNAMQMALLQKELDAPLAVNQLQFSAAHTTMVDSGINVNMMCDSGVARDGGILEYCRLHGVTIQTWSSLQYGFFEGTFLGSDLYAELNSVLNRLAQQYGVTPGAVAIAWILRHPAQMQAVIGSTSPERVTQLAKAMQITLTREE